jgi:RNA polymerase sigma factor FliA
MSDGNLKGKPAEKKQSASGVPDQVSELWDEYKKSATGPARNRLVEQYLPLVRYIADRIAARLPDAVDRDDLISAGAFGLMGALKSFDFERGVKFETYCVPRIRGAILDELRTMDWVPRLVRAKATKLSTAVKRLEIELGRKPSNLEIAEHLEVSPDEVERLISDAQAARLVSLNKKCFETDGKDVHEIDILEDRRSEDPTSRIQQTDLMRAVTKGLSKNERLIIILYYYEEMTMKEIGATLELSESRVSQMHSAIVKRLQSQLKAGASEL